MWSRRKGGWFFLFFFQAEDGIRDLTVTGVQTCALPISRRLPTWRRFRFRRGPLPTTRARLRTRGCRGGPRPPAPGLLRSAGAEYGHGASAFHLHGAAGRAGIDLRARVGLRDPVVVAQIRPRPPPPHAPGPRAR